MCEFMTTSLSCARRGNPATKRYAKREGRLFFKPFRLESYALWLLSQQKLAATALWTSKEMNEKFLRFSGFRPAPE